MRSASPLPTGIATSPPARNRSWRESEGPRPGRLAGSRRCGYAPQPRWAWRDCGYVLAALGLAGLWVRKRRTVTDAVLVQARHVLPRLDPDSPLALRVRARARARLADEAEYLRGEHATIVTVLDEVSTPPILPR
jgi:hypothetical protein